MHRFLTERLIRAIVIVLIALALYGAHPGVGFANIVMLLVIVRFAVLFSEFCRKRLPTGHWENLTSQWQQHYAQIPEEDRIAEAQREGIELPATAERLAEARVKEAAMRYVPPRKRPEVVSEAFGALTFLLLIPSAAEFFARDFFSLNLSMSWEDAVLLLLCTALYWWPHRWPDSLTRKRSRILWWLLPFTPALVLFMAGLTLHHPYLNPLRADHTKLAAERVLGLQDNVLAGRNAGWVKRYARELDASGDQKQAAYFYSEALRLDPNDEDVRARLAALSSPAGASGASASLTSSTDPYAPYWTESSPPKRAERRTIGPDMERIDGLIVVAVPVGDVPDELMDAVVHTVSHELNIPACVSTQRVPLPEHTRMRGLFTGPQWDGAEIVRASQVAIPSFPRAPVRYLLVTDADIYSANANYVFSMAFEWGGVVSAARFGGSNKTEAICRHRTAKQSLCVLIKSFGIRMSPQRECVTSYTRSLEEFDAKGNRPSAECMAAFQQQVAAVNEQWQRDRRR